ncbi:MAG: DUF3014 domain-containing protein [Gammaproteobacteria bacterium]|nr:DUF3014 domain-containing protein [Gammaproteobacteria bacterium]
MLATPDASAQIRLMQPHVLYPLEGLDLEVSSAGQNILIRMDPENVTPNIGGAAALCYPGRFQQPLPSA